MSERLPRITDDAAEAASSEEMAQFVRVGRGIQDVLQQVENALVDAGYADFVVATEHGSFHWQTAEHARAEAAETEIEDYSVP